MKQKISALVAVAALAFGLAGTAQAAPVNINKASAEQIADALKGVGVKRAKEVVSWRQKNGPFKSVEQLRQVKGFGGKTFDRNRQDIRLQ